MPEKDPTTSPRRGLYDAIGELLKVEGLPDAARDALADLEAKVRHIAPEAQSAGLWSNVADILAVHVPRDHDATEEARRIYAGWSASGGAGSGFEMIDGTRSVEVVGHTYYVIRTADGMVTMDWNYDTLMAGWELDADQASAIIRGMLAARRNGVAIGERSLSAKLRKLLGAAPDYGVSALEDRVDELEAGR